ncbi:hypothetical protein NUW58_g7697 [Xylaria curta]|uniref:Uncharacterized protein n=1 Tax=Xylaria curta TaxID=42375 RepID=A0ACC1NH04_9PEZI|nr:hypothetical protein NUW58_g7697 [Xylaria curta]
MAQADIANAATSLDVFILTFNAGKQHIDPSVFGLHLRDAFGKDGLPDLVVICLQEMSPLAHSFIGSYMINPYFQKYTSAVNIAASSSISSLTQGGEEHIEYSDGYQGQGERPLQDEPEGSPYTLVTTRHVGMTGIMLFALDSTALHDLRSTEVSFGAGEMANKGAVGLRMFYTKEDAQGLERKTELTFVATHLAPHEWNLEKRNKNWESVVSGLLFEDPKKLHGPKSVCPTPSPSTSDDEGGALLSQHQGPIEKALHDITIYKPGSHLFVAGDLNYRISKTRPNSESKLPDLDPKSANYFKEFLTLDQLTLERTAGRTLHGLHESTISFPPTYKLEIVDKKEPPRDVPTHQNSSRAARDVVRWKWVSNRWPGWCDRVLYLDVPPWASPLPPTKKMEIHTIAYDALPPVRTSDHRAVYLRLKVPVLEPSVLAPPHDLPAVLSNDPRVKLPYPVDFDAWESRARFKKWEPIIGWSMLVSQSSQGIAIFTILFLVGMGAWWLKSL